MPRDLPVHLALRGEAVEQHLGQRHLELETQQRLRAVVAIVAVSGRRIVRIFRTGGAAQVDRRQVLGAGLAQLLLDRPLVRGDHADFRIGRERGLYAFPDRGRERAVGRDQQGGQHHPSDDRTISRAARGVLSFLHIDLHQT